MGGKTTPVILHVVVSPELLPSVLLQQRLDLNLRLGVWRLGVWGLGCGVVGCGLWGVEFEV